MKKHIDYLVSYLSAGGVLFFLLAGSYNAFGVPAPKRLLIVTVTKGFRHDSIPTAEKVLADLAARGNFSVDYVRTDDDMAKKMTADSLGKYAAAVFANTTGDLPLPDKDAFLRWIESGKGFVGVHAAADTFRGHKPPDPFVVMLGGEFKSHGPQAEVEVINQDSHHPACKHFPSTFHIFDEIYLLSGFQRSRIHGLLTLDKHPNSGVPGDYPIAWCRMHGKGRVFYTSLGHRDEVWRNLEYQQHILGGIKWAIGLEKGAATPQGSAARLILSEAGQGFKLLYNGVDLNGWKPREPAGRQIWSSQNGMLVNDTSEKEPGNDLITLENYRDFIVRYEFMIPKNGSSGLFLRGRHEIQVLDDSEKGKADIGGKGALPQNAAPAKLVSAKAGQWQRVEATIKGNRASVILNGVKVLNNVTADRLPGGELNANSDDAGPIILQGDHGPVAFRNIRIKLL